MDTNHNKTTETNFNSTLLDDGTLFSSHTVNTLSLIDLENHDNNYDHNINHNDSVNDTDNNMNFSDSHRQTVNSIEFAHNSYLLTQPFQYYLV